MTLPVDEIEVAPEATSLQLLQAVYRNPDVPLSVRIRCAGMALPFESPRLSVTANVNDDGRFAERLERAIAQTQKVLMSRSNHVLIDATPPRPPPGPTDATLPPPIPDRRFRRV